METFGFALLPVIRADSDAPQARIWILEAHSARQFRLNPKIQLAAPLSGYLASLLP
jgi:hypothetical protein